MRLVQGKMGCHTQLLAIANTIVCDISSLSPFNISVQALKAIAIQYSLMDLQTAVLGPEQTLN